jgi:hypothetical protein
MLVLCAAASAQTARRESDPRNQSPTVGTGGPIGGPTGLFTIYDGSTIRKGEFTFSIAYSNYDRDPGNADITDIVTSFNVGLNDHIELFFHSTAYRGIKVNNPAQLSGFYMPNVNLCNAPCVGPAIILAPSGPNVGTLAGTTIFRPLNNQPLVGFPFIGSSAGTFGQGPGGLGTLFGFPGFNALIGNPIGGGSAHGPASQFPGMGSPVGGILPGIVLATTIIPCTALTGNCRPPQFPTPQSPITIPISYTVAPSYLPDTPFVSRPYGESSFDDFVVGGKIRFTKPGDPLGIGIIPFYRWYPDSANTAGSFNQLQRGAGPGGSFLKGDLGLIGFVDARLSTHVNVSANFGYIWNSNPRSSAMGDASLIDRPDEVLSGVGFDFPVNKHFQPIAEVRSTYYRGGTPNALHNNPIEVLGGAKVYPKRWFGFGVAYRRHLNEQDENHLDGGNVTNISVSNLSGVFVPGRGIIIVPGFTLPGTTTAGVPQGFRFSSDPNGFIVQAWAGHRNARGVPPNPNVAPTVSASASSSSITTPCDEGTSSDSCSPSSSWSVQLTGDGQDADKDTLLYSWSTTGGKVSGEGRNVTWDLTGAQAGTYTATVTVNDGNNHTATASTTVTIAKCSGCRPPPCPTVSASGPSEVKQGDPITFNASVGASNVTYNWSVSAGTISSGQGTSSITVDTAGLAGQSVTATVEVGGLAASCGRTASATTSVVAPPEAPKCTKLDEYGNIKFNDEKARLDALASALQSDPGAQAYIIGYGSCEGEGLARANRAKDYLVNTRQIDAGRITTVDGGCRAELWVQLYVCPTGAPAPTASTDGSVPCTSCKKVKTVKRPAVRHPKKKATDDDE